MEEVFAEIVMLIRFQRPRIMASWGTQDPNTYPNQWSEERK